MKNDPILRPSGPQAPASHWREVVARYQQPALGRAVWQLINTLLAVRPVDKSAGDPQPDNQPDFLYCRGHIFRGATIALWWEKRKIEFHHFFALFIIAIAQIPLLFYNFLIFSHDPFWSQFTFQNQTLSPPPIFYLWGFAPFWLFALFGIFSALRRNGLGLLGLGTWLVGAFLLAYLPVAIQRRFILGITIPLAALSIYGLEHLIRRVPAFTSMTSAW